MTGGVFVFGVALLESVGTGGVIGPVAGLVCNGGKGTDATECKDTIWA